MRKFKSRRAGFFQTIARTVPRLMGSSAITIRRSYTTGFTYAAGAGTGAYLSFSPAGLPSFSADFGNTFELVRVISCLVKWMPFANVNQIVNGQPLGMNPMYTAITTTVSTAPTSANQVLSFGTAQTFPAYATWQRRVNPTVAVALSSGNQYDISRQVWQSVGSNPQTNGLLIWVDNNGNANNTPAGVFVVSITFALANPY